MNVYEMCSRDGEPAIRLAQRTPSGPLRDREVRVRVAAVALNYRDVFLLKRAAERTAPVIPASDGAGQVVEVGGRVSRLRVGDRVMAGFFPTWLDGEMPDDARALGGAMDGMLSEQVVLDEQAWVKIPEHLSYAQAATLPCAGVAAWNSLFGAAKVGPGQTVLVQGTGGVSLFALQLARAAGAEVLATSSTRAKCERLRAMGARETFDYQSNPAWGRAALAATPRQRGVDVVVDIGGPGTFDQSLVALRPGGTMSSIGILTGVAGMINTFAISQKAIRIQGICVGSVRDLGALALAVVSAKLEPVIDRVFPFHEAAAAYEHLAQRRHFGKVVVSVSV
jgi:NADPH:quinone reductase-like Zn-dependent oxidoreductase